MVAQKQLENVKYFENLGNPITNDTRCTHEIKFRIAIAKTAFNKNTFFTSRLGFNIRKKWLECYIWNIAVLCMVLKLEHFRK
jgi:hypothetical protein